MKKHRGETEISWRKSNCRKQIPSLRLGNKRDVVRVTRLQKLKEGLYRTSVRTYAGYEKKLFCNLQQKLEPAAALEKNGRQIERTSGASFLLVSCLLLLPLLAESAKKQKST